MKLVFVGACYSHNAGQELVKAGVPHVVATHVDSKIDDLAARRFTRAFYLGTFLRRLFVRASIQNTPTDIFFCNFTFL